MNQTFPFQSDALPYSYAALMPYCDANTLYFHHDQYYTDAVYRLNKLVVAHRLTALDLRQLLTEKIALPPDQLSSLRDTAGLVFNHQFYFGCICTAAGDPPINPLTQAIVTTYGSIDAFRQLMVEAAQSTTGSNWLWLVSEGRKGIHLMITPNNFTVDLNFVSPILGVDLWEHAYFAMNHFDIAAYIRNWFRFIDWEAANRRYEASLTAWK